MSPTAEASEVESQPVRRVVLAMIAALLGPAIYLAGTVAPSAAAAPAPLVPEAPGWAEVDAELARPFQWTPSFGGATDSTETGWSNGSVTVLVDTRTYVDQAQASELITAANSIAPDSLVVGRRVHGPVGVRRWLVNEAIVRDADGTLLVWYWYRVGGVETASPLRAKLLEVLAFLRRRPDSALLAISTSCEPSTCEDASTALRGFLEGG